MSVLEIAVLFTLHVIASGFLLSLVLNDEIYSKWFCTGIGIGIALNVISALRMFVKLWQFSS